MPSLGRDEAILGVATCSVPAAAAALFPAVDQDLRGMYRSGSGAGGEPTGEDVGVINLSCWFFLPPKIPEKGIAARLSVEESGLDWADEGRALRLVRLTRFDAGLAWRGCARPCLGGA
eukprot:CAMPEP_0198696908 /NCGR_PEP_ID=MMETSP1468-20131203/314706_1 /TAXON_ID=1461545 /ORGANISM="Mantoniella sp, Strain CCMP1436" /LENGTH=117 /DNA_ID=CAMNT_0044453391 /DNA_START=800 /DNA_END=1150 /DNA_ORIENTATION=+